MLNRLVLILILLCLPAFAQDRAKPPDTPIPISKEQRDMLVAVFQSREFNTAQSEKFKAAAERDDEKMKNLILTWQVINKLDTSWEFDFTSLSFVKKKAEGKP